MTVPALSLVSDSDVLPRLQALAPKRVLSWAEDHAIAERQATLLLKLWGIAEPPVPQFVIASLPGIVVEWRRDWPISGVSIQTRSHWQIVISGEEPRWRQRFSLAHEFKHVIDDPVIGRTHQHLPAPARSVRAERICDYFAACLLMPRPWIKRDWCGGMQNSFLLAKRYSVSI